MRLVRLKSFFVVTIFASAVLFADEPSPESASSPPQVNLEEAKALPPSIQAMESIPNITTKKDIDKATDMFLKGGFCVVTAVLFLAGFFVVKSNSGSKVDVSA